MMECREVQPNLLDWRQGLLPPTEAESVRAHVDACAECRAALEAEEQVAASLKAMPRVQPRSDVWTLVQARIKPQPRRSFIMSIFAGLKPPTTRRLAAATAALAVVVLALFMVIPRQNAPVTIPPERETIEQAAALMQVSTTTQGDDPVGDTTDLMMKALKDEM